MRDERAIVGTWFGRRFWGTGANRESKALVAHLAFAVLGLHRLGSYSNPANERSTRALLGVGFRHEGVLRHWHRHGDRHLDVNVFGMLRDEWAAGGARARSRRGRPASRRRPSGPPALPAEAAHGQDRAHDRPHADDGEVAEVVGDARAVDHRAREPLDDVDERQRLGEVAQELRRVVDVVEDARR